MTEIPRMRTLPEAVKEIKQMDEKSALTLSALRRMVNNGDIPCVSIASKRLICLDTLLERLQNPTPKELSAEQYETVRGGRA